MAETSLLPRRGSRRARGRRACASARLLGVGLAAAALLAAAGCGHAPGFEGEVGRVVLFGVDGATWSVMDPMLEAGQLPNIAAMSEEGCRGTLKSLLPSLSPRIWTSIATGVPPKEHGILNFFRMIDGKRHLYTSQMRKRPTFWEIASAAGTRVGVVNYWFTYPVAPLEGFVVSDHTIPSRSRVLEDFWAHGESPPVETDKLVYPLELQTQIEPILESETLHSDGDVPPEVKGILREDEQVAEIALAAAAVYDPRLLVLYVKGVDRASHQFWIAYEPDNPVFKGRHPPKKLVERLGDAIPLVYRRSDALIGRVRAELGPQDVLLVVSDHGFAANPEPSLATGDHGFSPETVDGIYLIAGGPVSSESCPEKISLYDVAPTLLHLLGHAVPEYMRGQVATALLDATWQERHPVRTTQEMLQVERSGEPSSETVPGDEGRIERLRALGYFE